MNIENRADYKSAEIISMAADLELVRDCERGTPAIKAKGVEYLPKWPGEPQRKYNARKKAAVYFNTYRKVKKGLVGMVCKTNPELGKDIPSEIVEYLENIDLAGSHIDVFVKDLLDKALEGHAHVFVDMEKPLPPGSTVYQAEARKRRPFWSIYAKDQACNHLYDRINGEEVLTQVTLQEFATVRDGRYASRQIMQYRTMWLPIEDEDERGNAIRYGPMRWELKRHNATTNEFDVVDEGETKLERIPLVTCYTNKRGFMLSDPYLLELAHLTIAHYQEYSDLKTQARALVPILVHKEVQDVQPGAVPKDADNTDQTVTVVKQDITGPNITFRLPGKDDSLTWISHDSKGVDVARQNLQDLEQRMSALSLSIIAPKDKVAVTATDKLLDQGERTSELANVARALQDCIESCLGITAQYIGKADKNGDGGSIKIIMDTSDSPALLPEKAPPVPTPETKDMPRAA